MGMISTFLEQKINVENSEGLKAIRTLSLYEEKFKDLAICLSEDGEINFGEWSGWKIESYWYNDMRQFLSQIAKFIEGYVEFVYEEGYKFRIVFKDKKVFFQKEKEVIFSEMEEIKLKEVSN